MDKDKLIKHLEKEIDALKEKETMGDPDYYKLYYYRDEAYLLLLADIKKGMFDDNSYTPNIQYL